MENAQKIEAFSPEDQLTERRSHGLRDILTPLKVNSLTLKQKVLAGVMGVATAAGLTAAVIASGLPHDIKTFFAPTSPSLAACPNRNILGLNTLPLDEIKKLYVYPSVRFVGVGWKDFQPDRNGDYDFTSVDNQINYSLTEGQTPAIKFGDGDGFPDWARQMDKPINAQYSCTSAYVSRILKEDDVTVESFQNAVKAMVTRYKDRVSYWDYGIEPNCRGYDPVTYTKWLKHFSGAVRSVDPTAKIIAGHLSGADNNYLQEMYKAGAKPYFDLLAFDPYGLPLDIQALEGARRIMLENGDEAKGVWIGEWGISSKNGEARQAALIKEGLTYLASKPWIEAAFYHNYEREMWDKSNSKESLGYLGYSLLNDDGTPKEGFWVFKEAADACKIPVKGNKDEVRLDIYPTQVQVGQEITFTITGDASTYIEDDYEEAVKDCKGEWNNRTCTITKAGELRWRHAWKRCQYNNPFSCSDHLELSATFTSSKD